MEQDIQSRRDKVRSSGLSSLKCYCGEEVSNKEINTSMKKYNQLLCKKHYKHFEKAEWVEVTNKTFTER